MTKQTEWAGLALKPETPRENTLVVAAKYTAYARICGELAYTPLSFEAWFKADVEGRLMLTTHHASK